MAQAPLRCVGLSGHPTGEGIWSPLTTRNFREVGSVSLSLPLIKSPPGPTAPQDALTCRGLEQGTRRDRDRQDVPITPRWGQNPPIIPARSCVSWGVSLFFIAKAEMETRCNGFITCCKRNVSSLWFWGQFCAHSLFPEAERTFGGSPPQIQL